MDTQEKQTWIEEFDKLEDDLYGEPSSLSRDKIKNFIIDLEKETFKDGYEAAKEDYEIID